MTRPAALVHCKVHLLPEIHTSHWRRGFQTIRCLKDFAIFGKFGAYFIGCLGIGLDNFTLLQEKGE
jgi:hypothetical protein